jgi:hypothetical protein
MKKGPWLSPRAFFFWFCFTGLEWGILQVLGKCFCLGKSFVFIGLMLFGGEAWGLTGNWPSGGYAGPGKLILVLMSCVQRDKKAYPRG